ncbi:uncharacterized protein LOC142422251 [Tenrec ecaudatus]|uniref:uncharacterized protein LOC142422251 n=1 Tax=Tenrec ecaudatus TaxID=94439 RepID=UPI003F599DF4
MATRRLPKLQVSASGGTEEVGNLLENQFSAGDANLEDKERALYADASPPEKTRLLHFPDGSEVETPEKSPPGVLPKVADSEASLSNGSAPESAPLEDAAGPGEEEEGPPESSALPLDGAEGAAGSGLSMEEAGSGVPEEAAGSGEMEVELVSETDGERSTGPAQESGVPGEEPEVPGEDQEVLIGVREVEPGEEEADADPEASYYDNAESKDLHLRELSPSAESKEAQLSQEDRPREGLPVQGPSEASSEEESSIEHGGEEEGMTSEESKENSGDGASSEETGAADSEEARESQEAAESTNPGEKGVQSSTEELSTGSKGIEAQDPEEGQQDYYPQNSGAHHSCLIVA